MSFFRQLIEKYSSSTVWCLAYIDVNPYRRQRITTLFAEAGIEVKPSAGNLYVKKEQYEQAIHLLKAHGFSV